MKVCKATKSPPEHSRHCSSPNRTAESSQQILTVFLSLSLSIVTLNLLPCSLILQRKKISPHSPREFYSQTDESSRSSRSIMWMKAEEAARMKPDIISRRASCQTASRWLSLAVRARCPASPTFSASWPTTSTTIVHWPWHPARSTMLWCSWHWAEKIRR